MAARRPILGAAATVSSGIVVAAVATLHPLAGAQGTLLVALFLGELAIYDLGRSGDLSHREEARRRAWRRKWLPLLGAGLGGLVLVAYASGPRVLAVALLAAAVLAVLRETDLRARGADLDQKAPSPGNRGRASRPGPLLLDALITIPLGILVIGLQAISLSPDRGSVLLGWWLVATSLLSLPASLWTRRRRAKGEWGWTSPVQTIVALVLVGGIFSALSAAFAASVGTP